MTETFLVSKFRVFIVYFLLSIATTAGSVGFPPLPGSETTSATSIAQNSDNAATTTTVPVSPLALGLGLGIGLGVPVLIAVIVLLIFIPRFRARSKSANESKHHPQQQQQQQQQPQARSVAPVYAQVNKVPGNSQTVMNGNVNVAPYSEVVLNENNISGRPTSENIPKKIVYTSVRFPEQTSNPSVGSDSHHAAGEAKGQQEERYTALVTTEKGANPYEELNAF